MDEPTLFRSLSNAAKSFDSHATVEFKDLSIPERKHCFCRVLNKKALIEIIHTENGTFTLVYSKGQHPDLSEKICRKLVSLKNKRFSIDSQLDHPHLLHRICVSEEWPAKSEAVFHKIINSLESIGIEKIEKRSNTLYFIQYDEDRLYLSYENGYIQLEGYATDLVRILMILMFDCSYSDLEFPVSSNLVSKQILNRRELQTYNYIGEKLSEPSYSEHHQNYKMGMMKALAALCLEKVFRIYKLQLNIWSDIIPRGINDYTLDEEISSALPQLTSELLDVLVSKYIILSRDKFYDGIKYSMSTLPEDLFDKYINQGFALIEDIFQSIALSMGYYHSEEIQEIERNPVLREIIYEELN
jgi:hypothetical protein